MPRGVCCHERSEAGGVCAPISCEQHSTGGRRELAHRQARCCGQCISDVSEEKLQTIVDFQNDRVRNAQVRARRTGKPVHVPNLCLVLDDIAGAGTINFQTSNAMRFLACNGRHAQRVRGVGGDLA